MSNRQPHGDPTLTLRLATDDDGTDPVTADESYSDGLSSGSYKLDFRRTGADRRDYRRHDLEQQQITVSRWAGETEPQAFGRLIDLSAGGARIRAAKQHAAAAGRIRVRLELPAYAGISPFIKVASHDDGTAPRPTREWVGHMEVARVRPIAGRADEVEVAGRLVDMADADRGMLGLYLSTQPLAA